MITMMTRKNQVKKLSLSKFTSTNRTAPSIILLLVPQRHALNVKNKKESATDNLKDSDDEESLGSQDSDSNNKEEEEDDDNEEDNEEVDDDADEDQDEESPIKMPSKKTPPETRALMTHKTHKNQCLLLIPT